MKSRRWILVITISAFAAIAALWLLQRPDYRKIFDAGVFAANVSDWNTVALNAEALKTSPDHKAHASFLRGLELESRGQLERAFVEFSKANAHPETRAMAYHEAGDICYQLKHYGDCIRLLKQCLQWEPDRSETHRLLAAAYYDIGAMGMALQHLKDVERLAPDDFRPHYMQASILLDSERFGDAALAFAAAAERAETGSRVADEIRAEWGQCLIRLRRFEEALTAMKPAGDWPDLLARRAQAYFSLRRFEDARKLAEAALLKAPFHLEAALVAAQCDEQRGEAENGIRLLQECVARSPGQLLLHQRLGDMLASSGRTEEAVTHRQRASEIAELRARFSDAHQAAANDTTNADLRLQLAQLAENLGEPVLAAAWFHAALGLSPDNQSIQEQWKQFQGRHPEQVGLHSRKLLSSEPAMAVPASGSQEF